MLKKCIQFKYYIAMTQRIKTGLIKKSVPNKRRKTNSGYSVKENKFKKPSSFNFVVLIDK